MKRKIFMIFTTLCLLTTFPVCANENIKHGKITGKTVLAGAASLILWPGIGQAMNDANSHKVITHAVIGLVPITRFWSCYDAVVDRKGGYWDGKI